MIYELVFEGWVVFDSRIRGVAYKGESSIRQAQDTVHFCGSASRPIQHKSRAYVREVFKTGLENTLWPEIRR